MPDRGEPLDADVAREVEDDTLAAEVQLKPRAVYTRARVQAGADAIVIGNLFEKEKDPAKFREFAAAVHGK